MGRYNPNNSTQSTGTGRWVKPLQEPSIISKVINKTGEIGKDLIKGIVSPVATMVARPIQLGAEALGVSDVNVNKFTLGGLIAPTPQNKKDVIKDVGRGIETALTGGIGGTVSKSTALGTGIGALAPVAIKGISKLLKKEATPIVEKIIQKDAKNTDNIITVYHGGSGDEIPKKLHGDYFMTTNKQEAINYGKSKFGNNSVLNEVKVNKNDLSGPDSALSAKKGLELFPDKNGIYRPSVQKVELTKPTELIVGNTPSIESNRINENLVKQGFDELPAEQKAGYSAFQVKDQTIKITQHLDTNYDNFKQAVIDNKLPQDIQPVMAFNAVKNKAIQEGDFETQRLLAKSPLASVSSQSASNLRAAQEFIIDGADSVGIMSKLNKELEKNVEKKLGKSVVQAKQELVNNAEQTFKNEVKKITSKQSVADFINSIPDC